MSAPNPTEDTARVEETPYALLGGDAGMRALAERFYDLMDLEPAYADIRRLHQCATGRVDRPHTIRTTRRAYYVFAYRVRVSGSNAAATSPLSGIARTTGIIHT